MKLTAEQKARLKALLAFDAKSLSTADAAELATLQTAAKAEGYDPAADGTVTEDDVKRLVSEGVAGALKSLGIEKDAIANIQKSITDRSEAITPEALESLIQKHVGGSGFDQKALVEEIKKNFPAQSAGVSEVTLTKAFETFEKNLRTESRHQFQFSKGVEQFPIAHRNGNLSVAQKQLLNICLMNVSDEGLAVSNGGKGLARPKNANEGIEDAVRIAAERRGEAAVKSLRQSIVYQGKALTSTGVGTGDELVATDLSSDLLMRLYMESAVAAEFMASEIDMPTNPFELPMITTRTTFYTGSEAPGSDPTESSPGTSKPILSAAKLIGLAQYSYEADEDAIIAILPMLQEQMAAGAADALEGALINGDTTGTHQDSDINAITAHASKMFKGLRKYAIAGSLNTSLATGGLSAANFLALKKSMGKYGIKPRDLICIAGVKGYNDLVGLDETLTAEKVGNSVARILTGEAPNLYGVRIIASSQVREDLNASGVYDGVTLTKGSILLVHRPSWIMGVRKGFTVEIDVDKKRQINAVVASFRRAFVPKETPSASVQEVALGYNFNS